MFFYVLARTSQQTICACLHATYFGIRSRTKNMKQLYNSMKTVFELLFILSFCKFEVKTNAIDLSHIAGFTWSKFKKNPWGLVLSIIIIIICMFLLYTIPKIDDKPLIAHKDAIKKEYVNDNQKFVEYRILCDQQIQKKYFYIFRMQCIARFSA